MTIYITKNLSRESYTNIQFIVEADSMREAIRRFRCFHINSYYSYSNMEGITQDKIDVIDYGKVIDIYASG